MEPVAKLRKAGRSGAFSDCKADITLILQGLILLGSITVVLLILLQPVSYSECNRFPTSDFNRYQEQLEVYIVALQYDGNRRRTPRKR